MKQTQYSESFFNRREDSLVSARILVPAVLTYIRSKSVLDVGCGTGAFLSVFREHDSATDILGVDGAWMREEQLLIPTSCFRPANLENPLSLGRLFDLVISLEVAEHLSSEYAQTFVKNLTRHGDVILFSAAIPDQGGTHHVNEQWPLYWAELFRKEGYVPIDCIRREVWDEPSVSFWYAQNTFFFVKRSALHKHPRLWKAFEERGETMLSLVHPTLFKSKAQKARRFDVLTAFIPWSVKGKILALIRRLRGS